MKCHTSQEVAVNTGVVLNEQILKNPPPKHCVHPHKPGTPHPTQQYPTPPVAVADGPSQVSSAGNPLRSPAKERQVPTFP